jgi:hypothetical protein
VLPSLTVDKMLPAGIHPATLDEVEELFVDKAPFSDERREIWAALRLYITMLRKLVPSATIWMDGGFVTHKTWAPADIDLAVLLDGSHMSSFTPEQLQKLAQLMTLQGVRVTAPLAATPRLQPMGGLIDAFVLEASDPAARQLWESTWSRVYDQNKVLVPGRSKGFVEVVV